MSDNINSWMSDVSRGRKRHWTESIASDTDFLDSNSAVSASSSPSRRNNARKKRKTAGDLSAREQELVKRFAQLEFLGQNSWSRHMPKEMKLAPPCEVFKQFVDENPGLFEDVSFDDYVFVEANAVIELNHLERFCRDYTPVQPQYEPHLAAAVNIVADKLDLGYQLVFPVEDELEEVRYRGDKFAGVEYAAQGFKTRAEAQHLALDDAKEAFRKLMDGEHVAPHVNRMGGRGKMTKKAKHEQAGDKSAAGRLILMSSQRDALLCGLTEQRLTHALKAPEFPVSVGKAWWKGGVEELLSRFGDFDIFACFDAEKFDSSLPPWLLRLAVYILRGLFEDGYNEKYDAYWRFVEEGLIEAPVCLDNGLMFRRKGGSTSGHNHNTLVQSVCTLICVYTCYLVLEGVESAEELCRDVHSESLGDDQLTGARGRFAKYTIDDIAPIAQAVFGINWTGDKSFNTTRLTDDVEGDFQGIQYLGKYFRWLDEEWDEISIQANVPYRPFVETAVRLYFPERGFQGVQAAWQRAVGHYADAAGNTRTRAVMDKYLDWLEPKVEETDFVWSDRAIRKLNCNMDDVNPPVPTRRISFGEWLAAVINNPDVE